MKIQWNYEALIGCAKNNQKQRRLLHWTGDSCKFSLRIILKEIPAQVFSCKACESFQNSFFYRISPRDNFWFDWENDCLKTSLLAKTSTFEIFKANTLQLQINIIILKFTLHQAKKNIKIKRKKSNLLCQIHAKS